MSAKFAVGWLWDFTRLPTAGFVPVVSRGGIVAALSSTVKRVGHQASAADRR